MADKEQKQNRSRREKILTDEEIAGIPLVEWELKPKMRDKAKPQQTKLLFHCWTTKDSSTIYKLLQLFKSKGNKFWIDNARRALFTFKPPEYDNEVWSQFHQLFKSHTTPKEYEKASVLILPIIASMGSTDSKDSENKDNTNENSLEKSYEIFKSLLDKNGCAPSLRSIVTLLEICCKNIDQENPSSDASKKSIEIAMDIYKIVKDYNVDTTQSSSTGYFDFLFQIFAFNRSSTDEFNQLFEEFVQSDNSVIVDTTHQALIAYLNSIPDIEINENLTSDLDGYLFTNEAGDDDGAEAKTQKLENVKIPRFRLSAMENSEIWEQLRLTQMNDDALLRYQNKLIYSNKTRAKKMGILNSNHNKDAKQQEENEDVDVAMDAETQKNNFRRHKYDSFVKYMLSDGGAEVIIDGANVGHMLVQNCFSFDFVDHVASHYAYTQHKRVRIILCAYRVINAENSRNVRVQQIIQKWKNNQWLIQAPNALYDDVLWSIYALHSCLIYNGRVIIITNDEMRDHAMNLHRIKNLFSDFLRTKLCRIQVFQGQTPLKYDPFVSFSEQTNDKVEHNNDGEEDDNSQNKRKRDLGEMEQGENEQDDAEPALKKQKTSDGALDVEVVSNVSNVNPSYQNFHHRVEYIDKVFPYTLHPPHVYVIKPQFYRYRLKEDEKQEQLIWFLPRLSQSSDCKNPQNVLKHPYSDVIIKNRIRWTVARLKRAVL